MRFGMELRTRILLTVVTTIAGIALLVVIFSGSSEARSELDAFLENWEQRRYGEAAAATNALEADVVAALEENEAGLDAAVLDTEVLEFDEDGDEARGEVRLRWDIPVIGGFEYTGDVLLERTEDEWRVRWSPAVIHPELDSGQRLGTVRDFADRAPILDRDRRELVAERPVVDVGVIPENVEDADAAIGAIADNTEADAGTMRRALRGAAPKQFVVAITLREQEFLPIRDRLAAVPGVEFANRTMPLAPSREFGRALLGTVGPITEEQLENLGEPYAVADQVGQWGLEAVFERRLAGTPTGRVVVRNEDGIPIETLHEVDGEPGRALRTTLDREAQEAAEAALGDRPARAALVAIQPSTGDVLAAASRPVANTFNRALAGRYPPGSTFKVVSTAALLESGLDPAETVECPAEATVGGRRFRNFEGSARGAVPFREDFVESCNTAFVSLASRVEPDALAEMAQRFGFGREHELPVESFSGTVPEPRDDVEHAATIIGQGRVLASPLAMSGVAATVAAGRWQRPRLIASNQEESGPRLEARIRDTLRSLMREVVTSGTGSAAASVAGLAGKTGTAEFGGGDPPRTHAWFIAFRDDVAVAVLVENAPSGGEVAAPIAAAFFSALGS